MRNACIVLVAAASLLSTVALAGERTSGNTGTGAEPTRSAGPQFPIRKGSRGQARLEAGASRDVTTPTAEEAKRLFTLVGHTNTGGETRLVPTDEIVKAATGQ
jgi:hypothetical protein